MRTETSFEKFKGEISIIVSDTVFEQDALELSIDEAQELLLQLGEVIMKVQGHVQTSRNQ